MIIKIIQIQINSITSEKIICGDKLLTKSCYMTYYENDTLNKYVYPCDFGEFFS